MAQIDVDPRALVDFSAELNRRLSTLRHRHEQLGGELRDLVSKGIWADSSSDTYRRSFDEATREIEALARNGNAYCQYLERQAERIRLYLEYGQRGI